MPLVDRIIGTGNITQLEKLLSLQLIDIYHAPYSKSSFNALQSAASTNKNDMVKCLISYDKSHINKQTSNGSTVLHLLACGENIDTMTYVLNNTNINKNIKNKLGMTAFDLLSQEQVNTINNQTSSHRPNEQKQAPVDNLNNFCKCLSVQCIIDKIKSLNGPLINYHIQGWVKKFETYKEMSKSSSKYRISLVQELGNITNLLYGNEMYAQTIFFAKKLFLLSYEFMAMDCNYKSHNINLTSQYSKLIVTALVRLSLSYAGLGKKDLSDAAHKMLPIACENARYYNETALAKTKKRLLEQTKPESPKKTSNSFIPKYTNNKKEHKHKENFDCKNAPKSAIMVLSSRSSNKYKLPDRI